MAPISTLDAASYDRLVSELIAAGFEPVPGSDCRKWVGPIDPAFEGLTESTSMQLVFRDGWPFRHPQLIVAGLSSEHVSAEGVVCLWREDDNSRAWLTLAGIRARICGWCARARNGFGPSDLALDAYLGFAQRCPCLAVFDLASMSAAASSDGQSIDLHATALGPNAIELATAAAPAGALRGKCYRRNVSMRPPQALKAFRQALTKGQQRNLERGLERLLAGDDRGVDFAVLLFPRSAYLDALVVRFQVTDSDITAQALEPAPGDLGTLLLRAGPAAGALHHQLAVMFGLGAIGSHTAALLAQSGLGAVRLVDSDILRPGNVVRHLGGRDKVGMQKTEVVENWIHAHAPWTQVETHSVAWQEEELLGLFDGSSVIVDTTGNGPLLEILSRLVEREAATLISAALYRGGDVARVRVQRPGKTPIYLRADSGDFPVIPSGDEKLGLEVGCSSPVNNAGPNRVAFISAMLVELAIRTMTEDTAVPSDLLHIFAPVGAPPFDRIGSVEIE